MINANDCVVGRWFNRKHGKGWTWIQFDESVIRSIFSDSLELALNDFEPIPLTPEILEKAGFERRVYDNNKKNPIIVEHLPELAAKDFFDHRKYITEDGWQIVIEETDEWDIRYGKEEVEEEMLPLVSIESLHQLQNLYFALTGEELTINL